MFRRFLYGTIFLKQNRLINLLQLSKKKFCSIDIIESFIRNAMDQVIFFYLFCLVVCCFFRSLFVSYSYLLLIVSYKNIVLEQLVNKSTAIDNSVFEVIKSSNKISLTKKYYITRTKYTDKHCCNKRTRLWKKY